MAVSKAKVIELACEVCGKMDELLLCSGCREVRYCSREHQSQDWKNGHKTLCQWKKKGRQEKDKEPEWYEKLPKPPAVPAGPPITNVGVDNKNPDGQAKAIFDQIMAQEEATPLKDCTSAELVRRGHKHVKKGEVEKMIDAWTIGAEKGFKECQFELGRALHRGAFGAKRDQAQGITWLTKAAQQGEASAQSELAIAFKNGDGVSVSVTTAFAWAKKAADHGDAVSMLNVGSAYAVGDPVEKDMSLAATWWTKAAEAGNDTAACNAAMCYMRGDGVAKTPEKAKQILEQSAEGGSNAAKNMLKRFGFGSG